MKRTPLPLVVLILTLLVPPASAADVFDDPVSFDSPPEALTSTLEDLQSAPVVESEFTEIRRMQALSRPLESSGKMIFSRERGLHRRIESPVPQEQYVGPDGLVVERYPDGEVNRMNLSGQSAGRFVSLTFDLFAGNIRTLGNSMDLYFTEGADGWVLGIKPGDSSREFVRSITMSGRHRRIEEMTMVHAGGDTTTTMFKNTTISDTLTSEQKAVFRSLKRE